MKKLIVFAIFQSLIVCLLLIFGGDHKDLAKNHEETLPSNLATRSNKKYIHYFQESAQGDTLVRRCKTARK